MKPRLFPLLSLLVVVSLLGQGAPLPTAAELGYVQTIEAAGGEVVADTCAVVAPMRMLNVQGMTTNAGMYLPQQSGAVAGL